MKSYKQHILAAAIVASFGSRRGDGDGDDQTYTKTDLDNAVKSAVELAVNEATSGLKTKNDELLGKLTDANSKLKTFDGMDFDDVKSTLDLVRNNEDIKLIKEGKIDEVINRRMEKVTAQHDETVSELTKQIEGLKTNQNLYKDKYESKLIDDSLRAEAAKAGVRNEAIEDIILRGKMVFSVGEDGSIEARNNEGSLAKNDDGKVLTPQVFIDDLKGTSPHYWPTDVGGDFGGSGGSGDSSSLAGIEAQMQKAASAGNMKRYRELKAKRQKMQG